MGKRGPKPKDPSEVELAVVAEMASYGFSQEWIARILKVSEKTLRKKYREVLDTAEIKLKCENARMAIESAAWETPPCVYSLPRCVWAGRNVQSLRWSPGRMPPDSRWLCVLRGNEEGSAQAGQVLY